MPKRSQPPLPRVKKRKHLRQNLGFLVNYNYAVKAAETWTSLGSCALTMGIHNLALKAFEAALSHTPGSLPTLLGWSHLLRMNDVSVNETVGCQAALQRLTKAAEQYPELAKSADFFKELTECYLLVNLNDPAQQSVQQAIQLQPNDASLFLLLAQALIRMGLRAQAASSLAHSLKLLPTALAHFTAADIETARTAHAELAAIAAAEGNIEASINELTATLMLPPPPLARINEHIALWCALATALERANKIPEALDACERAELAVGLLPRILITHAYLLLLDELKAHAERAVELLTRVVEAEPRGGPTATATATPTPTPPGTTAAAGAVAATNKDADTPETSAAAAASEDTLGDFLPWCLLGKAYTLLDSPRAAYDSYQIALRRADGLPITWLAVGKLYLELKQLPDALAAYSQALRLQLNENSPGTAAAWDGLSCVYERCDDQLGDAADACSRAALCFQTYGDAKNADFYESRAKVLRLAAEGKAPVPEWSEPVGVPNYFLRDLVNLLPNERIAFVKSINKPEAAGPSGGSVGGKLHSGSSAIHERNPLDPSMAYAQAQAHAQAQTQAQAQAQSQGKPRNPYDTPLQYPSDTSYQPRGSGLPYSNRQLHPYDSIPRGSSVIPGTPPPGQPQYVHPGTPSHVVHQPPAYGLAPPYQQPDSKLPGLANQQMQHPGGRHYWPGHDATGTGGVGNPAHPMARGPPALLNPYGPPPPASMMSPPPAGAQGPANGAHRSPAALPQVPAEGYPMAMPPGYAAYGQYMPMHGGMVAQMQPYAGAHWRR